MRSRRIMTSADWIMLVVLSIVWGASYFFFKILVAELPVLTIVMIRVTAAALMLLAIVYLTGGSMPRSLRIWAAFAVVGIFNNVIPFGLIIWSETQIQSGLASILTATTPLFVVLLGQFLTLDERLTPNRIVGVLIGLAGVGVLIGPNAISGLNLGSGAQLAVIAASISYAWVSIYARRFKALSIQPLVAATGQTIAAALVVTPLAVAVDRPWTLAHGPSTAAWGALGGLVVLSTVIAYILYFRILASAGATNVLLVTLLTPISTLILGGLILGEHISAADALGMLLIFVGLAAIDGRLLGLFRKTKELPI